MTNPLVDQAGDAFAAALAKYRTERGLSKKQLAAEMGFDPSYVSHVEARRHRPTEDFARRAEVVLRAGGEIWRRYRDYDEARHQSNASRHPLRDPPVPEQWFPPGTGVIVEREDATLSYLDGTYRCTVRRVLFNAGHEPVTRYLIRISVDRYPGEADRSNRHYRQHPLTWAELGLTARCADEPMLWRAKHDRDTFKEVWLLFENDEARFPLYPGQRATIEYSYEVHEDKWGHWFQRAIRLPTRRLGVRLDFPAALEPVVWGVETSLTAEAGPLRSAVTEQRDGDRVVFEWLTEDPPLNARYRLEWRFRGRIARAVVSARPSDSMRDAGVVQRGAPVLTRPTRWFELPEQESLARDVVARLLDALDQIGSLHDFQKGVGLAAPQLGIAWAAAVVRPAGPEEVPIVLLNPRVTAESAEADDQYEGCLSFFDVRGLVSRPLAIEVERAELSGARVVTTFTNAVARLVTHEVDHLNGLLYVDRMPPGAGLVPVEEYLEQGQPWRY